MGGLVEVGGTLDEVVPRESQDAPTEETGLDVAVVITIEIRQPAVRQGEDGRRLAASYINFYLANGAVILPIFDDAMDSAAFHAIQAAFPDRRIVQVDAFDLIYGGGGIHCITQQQPALEVA